MALTITDARYYPVPIQLGGALTFELTVSAEADAGGDYVKVSATLTVYDADGNAVHSETMGQPGGGVHTFVFHWMPPVAGSFGPLFNVSGLQSKTIIEIRRIVCNGIVITRKTITLTDSACTRTECGAPESLCPFTFANPVESIDPSGATCSCSVVVDDRSTLPQVSDPAPTGTPAVGLQDLEPVSFPSVQRP
jgi:hypothetical protein